jgi:hypothetical protein
MKKVAIGLVVLMAGSGLRAETVLVQDSFDGKHLDSAWSKYLNSPIFVADGKLYLSNGDAVSSAHRAFITRNTDRSGRETDGAAKVFNFFNHGLKLDLGLSGLSGEAGTGAARISWFVGIASDASAEKLTPATAKDGVFFQIEKLVSGDFRMVMTERVDGANTITYIGKLSGSPSGLGAILNGSIWTLTLTGAEFTDGINHGTSGARGELRAVKESDLSDFNLTVGVMHLGAAEVAGAMEVDHISIKALPSAQTATALHAAVRSNAPLDILNSGYPRAFFFRTTETHAASPNVTYDRWEGAYSRLQGVMGKALDEEIVGREKRNPEFYTRFKADHPEQVVLLHFNGNARDPRYEIDKFFAGHWLYEEAAEILSDVPAETGETEIRVSNTEHFKTGIGRFNNSSTDVGLFSVKDGKHDWETGEQVELISVDHENKTIRVKRGCYGTVPRAFSARDSRAAAHVSEGPWAKDNPMLWVYNFSTKCPRDSKGRNCADALTDDLTGKFLPGGKLAAFDGLQFDVAVDANEGDMDGDGKADDGLFDGVNTYGVGLVEFYKKLRAALGDDRLILADGVSRINQRGFGVINGIESEGWPHHPDLMIQGWSGGMNRHMFWNREAHAPVFNYINHRFTDNSGTTVKEKYLPTRPFSIHRLVFAAAQFMDAPICYSSFPEPEPGELCGIWDELKKGVENELGWLGMPEGPAVHLAKETSDLLKESGWNRLVSQDGKQVLKQTISLPEQGTDLLITIRASADPLKGHPESYARVMDITLEEDGLDPSTPPSGWERLARPMSWVNGEEFESIAYFRGVTNGQAVITVEIQGSEPATIHSMTAHAAPDSMARIFEHGLVLANPSNTESVAFDLSRLAPGRSYRRLQGASMQDIQTNSGQPVGATVTLGPLDGLFLVRTDKK